MKSIPFISALAAVIALVVVPTAAVAGILFFAVSLVTIFTADYGRAIKPLAPRADVLEFRSASPIQVCERAA